MNSHSYDDFELPEEDREKLKYLTCPVPENEIRRIGILQQTRLLDSSPMEPSFDRFTHLSSLVFNMPISLVTLVDIDRVWYKSRLGVDWTDVSRNDSFSSWVVLPDAPDVFVVHDVLEDERFKSWDLTKDGMPVRFYAGAAVVVEDVKIGALCILDTEPHPEFGFEDMENLLDICVGVSQLAFERRQHTLNLNAERANIVVSMMHNLRTPMTTLNFASAMLETEATKLRPPPPKETPAAGAAPGTHAGMGPHHVQSGDEDDDGVDGHGSVLVGTGLGMRHSFVVDNDISQGNVTTTTGTSDSPTHTAPHLAHLNIDKNGSDEAKGEHDQGDNIDNIEPSFSTFDVCFREITVALKQLNLLVDSSLNLGQAIVKINAQNARDNSPRAGHHLGSLSAGISERSGGLQASSSHSFVPSAPVSKSPTPKGGSYRPGVIHNTNEGDFALYPEMKNSRLVGCDLLEHIENIYNALIHQVIGVSVSWEVNPAYLTLGKHASHPEAVSLVLLSTIGQLGAQHKNVRIRFSFERLAHEEDWEFPELAKKLIEGMLLIKIQSYTKIERAGKSPKVAHSGKSMKLGRDSDKIADNTFDDYHGRVEKVPSTDTIGSTYSSAAVTPSMADRLNMPLAGTAEDPANNYNSTYNLMSVNKILRTVNGGCREYPEPIPDQPARSLKAVLHPDGISAEEEDAVCMPTQEFWIPCKILPSAENLSAMAAGGEVITGDNTVVKHLLQKASSSWGSHSHSHSVSKKNSNSYDYSASTKGLMPEGFSASAPASSKIQFVQSDMSGSSSFTLADGASTQKRSSADPSAGIATIDEHSAKSAAEGHAAPPVEPKVLRVLIIEDTVPVQKLLSRWMQKARCKVTCANNGSIGLNYLMTGCFDIVFVDFLMPVMLGVTTMKLFQAWVHEHCDTNEIAAYNKQILVIGMSATALESEQEAAFDYGMHFFCPKPANMDVLGMMIEAKRQCRSNEDALDRICEATGTDVWSGAPEPDLVGDGEPQQYGDAVGGTPRASPRMGAHASSAPMTFGVPDVSPERDLGDSAKNSERSSGKGSGKDSGKGSDKVPSTGTADGEASVNSASASAAAAAVTAGGGALAGSIGNNSSNSMGGAVKVVTDSKSAAMWSVFRSYRQSARTVPVQVQSSESSRQHSFVTDSSSI